MSHPVNQTLDGKDACAFGTPWMSHFDGTGCPHCDGQTAELDRPCIWLHLSERELGGLILNQVVPSLREQARQMSEQHFQERLKANAAKPLYRKRRKVQDVTVATD